MILELLQAVSCPFALSLLCWLFKITIQKTGNSDNYGILPATLVESIRDRSSLGLELTFLSLVVLVSTYQMRGTTVSSYSFIADEKEWFKLFLILIIIIALLIVAAFYLTIVTCKKEHQMELDRKKDMISSCKLANLPGYCINLETIEADRLKKRSIQKFLNRTLIAAIGSGTLFFSFNFFYLSNFFFSTLLPKFSRYIP